MKDCVCLTDSVVCIDKNNRALNNIVKRTIESTKVIYSLNKDCKNCRKSLLIMQDGEFIAIMCIFAVSNGYLGTISMIHGPKTVEDSKSQEGVAMMLAACLVIGIAAGSSLSYPVLNIIQ